MSGPELEQQPRGEIEYRQATQLSVSFPERTIELVVMPYGAEALVEHKGRMIRETVERGAFDGIERRANRVRVNRDHDVTRTVGRAVAFHPARDEGLVAELRIAQTQLGDETLQLADEELLDASAGFLPMADGERWEGRTRRVLRRVWLAHIAMTPDPAYVGARVLAVRQRPNGEPVAASRVATPHLDELRAAILAERYARLDR